MNCTLNFTRLEKFMIGIVLGGITLYWVHRHYQVAVNLTPSLPYKVFLIKKGESARRGELLAFQWQGGLGYAQGVTMIKKIAATAGDVVVRQERDFFVEGRHIAQAITQTDKNKTLDVAPGGKIASGQYFVVATHPASLDSRYRQFGTVNQQQVIGRAYPIW